MFQSRVIIPCPLRQRRRALNISPYEQRRMRLFVGEKPIRGKLEFPLISVLGRARKAGIYTDSMSIRNQYGIPVEIQLRWIFVTPIAPIFLLGLQLGSTPMPPLTLNEMTSLNMFAEQLVEQYIYNDA